MKTKKLIENKLNEVIRNIDSIDERYAIGKINDDLYNKFTSKYSAQKVQLLQDLGFVKNEFKP